MMHPALATHPRALLGFLPTPLVELKRLSRHLGGPRIFIKRDDQTGLALGGNKTRKLEYLLGDALAQKCDCLITGGAAQSNHCRQTAAAAAACGLECHLVLGGSAPLLADGNLLLDQLLGAEIHWSGELRKGETIPQIARQLEAQGRRPYIIPYGGSNPIGALGYVNAAGELKETLVQHDLPISQIYFASSSGGTQAGLMLGAKMFDLGCGINGIRIDKQETGDQPYAELVSDLANATAEWLQLKTRFQSQDVSLHEQFTGEGYGVVGSLEREAIRLLARHEGILLDPVYTGRAMGGLLQLIEEGAFAQDEPILYWHTGGTPALFPYAGEVGREDR